MGLFSYCIAALSSNPNLVPGEKVLVETGHKMARNESIKNLCYPALDIDTMTSANFFPNLTNLWSPVRVFSWSWIKRAHNAQLGCVIILTTVRRNKGPKSPFQQLGNQFFKMSSNRRVFFRTHLMQRKNILAFFMGFRCQWNFKI